MDSGALIGGIDAGGTTFKCGFRTAGGEWMAKARVATTSPENTLDGCARFFAAAPQPIVALGVASFGPVGLDVASPDYGRILDTPKPGWSGADMVGGLGRRLGVPVRIDTDVNGALVAEMRAGAARDVDCAAYITVGTGIGAGIALDGRVVGRPHHPEFGHIAVGRAEGDDGFAGVCPAHGDCLEGLASVTALAARWGDPAGWGPDHEGWAVSADYLAQACRALVLMLRLPRIVLGGGLMLADGHLERVKASLVAQMAGYVGFDRMAADRLLRTPGLGDDAGLFGASLIAQRP